eukprot:scaffold73164_cov69-Phaeocystis_antarctica.AAC.8
MLRPYVLRPAEPAENLEAPVRNSSNGYAGGSSQLSRGELPWLRDTIAGGAIRRAGAPASGASRMAGLAARRKSMLGTDAGAVWIAALGASQRSAGSISLANNNEPATQHQNPRRKVRTKADTCLPPASLPHSLMLVSAQLPDRQKPSSHQAMMPRVGSWFLVGRLRTEDVTHVRKLAV